ncbi:MAG: endonuclease/exonuclease/phosphatase family protein [Planctomycetaceae bacterium]|nr:endonuclease/exonuclease/phosphatase family protein [Planctomycetaceae bacterium]
MRIEFRPSRAACAVGLLVIVASAPLPAVERTVRIATFNVQELNWIKLQEVDGAGRGTHPQLVAAAEIVQRVRPDVLLLNEIDYTGPVDADGQPPADRDALGEFLKRYLRHSQNGAEPIEYPHRFYRPSNTGVPSGLDFNNDGDANGPNDAYGFGRYPGEYAMALVSRFPIDAAHARTFRKLLWKDVPSHVMPDGRDGRPAFYAPATIAAFRLSSKCHWDVPVTIDGQTVHLLCSHPTPPVFDGPEDAHGRRNHDELRFWSDYLTGGDAAKWIRDDAGRTGGLPEDAAFVVLGDLNAEPVRAEAAYGRRPIEWLFRHPRVFDPQPQSPGGRADSNPAGLANYLPFKTSHFGRLDYALPSRNLAVKESGVFWPGPTEPLHAAAETASDHRLVWVDVLISGQ